METRQTSPETHLHILIKHTKKTHLQSLHYAPSLQFVFSHSSFRSFQHAWLARDTQTQSGAHSAHQLLGPDERISTEIWLRLYMSTDVHQTFFKRSPGLLWQASVARAEQTGCAINCRKTTSLQDTETNKTRRQWLPFNLFLSMKRQLCVQAQTRAGKKWLFMQFFFFKGKKKQWMATTTKITPTCDLKKI